MDFVVRELTPDLWHALEDLRYDRPLGRCWALLATRKPVSRRQRTRTERINEVVDPAHPPPVGIREGLPSVVSAHAP